jgi:cholesterol transport system auxiliary component
MRLALTRRFGFGVAALVLFAAPGCISVLPDSEPETLYRLTTADLGGAGPADGAATVIVGGLDAPRGLAGDRIALQRDGQIAYMAGAAWLSPAPDLLHSAIVDSFYLNAPALAPAGVTDGVDARFDLDLELRHFEAVYDQSERTAPTIRVGLRARLIDRDTRMLIGAQTLEANVRSVENRQSAIVSAFSRASSEAARQLADWTQAQICSVDEPPAACR